MTPAGEPLLTLEPLLEAVRAGVEGADWTLSGLQKTTSHQFEGRWEGDSTRSAYLFFHRSPGPEWASVEVFLDETSRGLSGNLALVVDLARLGGLGDVAQALSALAGMCAGALPSGVRTPLTLRLNLPSPDVPPEEAEAEVRFKLRIPRGIFDAGSEAVSVLATATVRRFDALMDAEGLQRFLEP